MYAGNIQIRGGKYLKPPKPCCDLAIKYVKKNWVFPIKIHITFVILCIYVKIQMQQLDIATDKKHELPDCDVRVYYLYRVKIERKSFY